jgi:CubicO group peptidase (beta-lactamase class C family)
MYSMTKPITCVAFMMLFEEGRFLLSDPVSRFIPEFANLKVFVERTDAGVTVTDMEREITLRDLLTHTAGLGYGLFEDTPVEDMYREHGFLTLPVKLLGPSLPEMIQKLGRLPLAHQPGTCWRYSLAHDVIGYLVGVISDTPFDRFLQERVLGPLGMGDTGFYVPAGRLDRLPALYLPGGPDGLTMVDAPSTSLFLNPDNTPSGGGGLVSTATDYLRFAQMLLNGGELDGTRLLSRKTVDMMTMNHLPDRLRPYHVGPFFEEGMGYGLGLGVVMDRVQARTLKSEGTVSWGGAAGTDFWVDPEEELVGLLMTQCLDLDEPVAGVFHNLIHQAIVE